MIDRLITDQRDLKRLLAFLTHHKLPMTVKVADGRQRSIEQNRLQWLWAAEAAMQRQDVTPREVQCEWKLMFGVPILAAENDDFAAMWLRQEARLSYEDRLALIEFVSVTSLMTSKQLSSYLDQVLRHNAERGIELTDPNGIEGTTISRGMGGRDAADRDTAAGAKESRAASKREVQRLHSGLQWEIAATDGSPASVDKRGRKS